MNRMLVLVTPALLIVTLHAVDPGKPFRIRRSK
jgi:hypothetical protein